MITVVFYYTSARHRVFDHGCQKQFLNGFLINKNTGTAALKKLPVMLTLSLADFLTLVFRLGSIEPSA